MDPLIIKNDNMWNAFDEKALLVGLERKAGETNIELRNRIVGRDFANSTKEGLSNWTLDLFNVDEVYPGGVFNDLTEDYIFYSEHTPLSRHEYDQIRNPDIAYAYPVVYDYTLDTTYTLAYYDNVYDKSASDEWKLYKTADLKYSRIWQSNYITNEVELRYLTIIDDDIYEVIESPRRPDES